MDSSRFDALTRRLGQRATRRSALKTLGGSVATLVAGVAVGPAGSRTLTICHATGNPAAPYQEMTIQQAEFNLYARQGDFMRVDCCNAQDCPSSSGPCGVSVCQNGYCVELPKEAGAPCGNGTFCGGLTACDGAFSCVTGEPAICPKPLSPCRSSACDEAIQSCVELMLSGFACSTPEQPDGICLSGICSPTCDGCAAINGYLGTCPGAAETTPSLEISLAPSSNPDFCTITVNLSGFAGCTTYTGQYGDPSFPAIFGNRSVTTGVDGSATLGLGSYANSGAIIQFTIGNVSASRTVVSSCS